MAKNSLTVADAKVVEEAFGRRLSDLAQDTDTTPEPQDAHGQSEPLKSGDADAAPTPKIAPSQEPTAGEPAPVAVAYEAPNGIDKSVLALAEPRRHRNKEHLRFVARQACLVCGRKHSDPHHLSFMQPRAMARKVSDEYVVPLCRIHHRAVHRVTDEQVWWTQQGVDPVVVARNLWASTRLNEPVGHPQAKTELDEPSAALASTGLVAKPRA